MSSNFRSPVELLMSKLQSCEVHRYRRPPSGRWRRSYAVATALTLAAACRAEPVEAPPQPQPDQLTRFEGAVQLPDGAALHYQAILVADPALLGRYLGTIDIPQQALSGASLERVLFRPGEHVAFELEAPGEPTWMGHYNADGSIACQFFQADATLPCSMREVTELRPKPPAPSLARQTPRPPFPYRVVDVKVENSAAHLLLAGTLTLPPGAGRHPAVLLVHGDSARDRDGTHGRHKPWLVLADRLTRSGFAVLRLDARGVGGSGAGSAEPAQADLEGDVRAALEFSKRRSEIDSRHVGLVGFGSGAVLAADLASHNAGIAFLVLLGAPAEPISAFAGVRCPVLALSGELDREVDSTESLTALRAALLGSPSAILDSLPGIDHEFQHAGADAPPAAASEVSFAPEALERIESWLSHLRP